MRRTMDRCIGRHRSDSGVRAAADGGADEALDIAQAGRFIGRHKRDGASFLSRACRSADAVDVVGRVIGEIEIDDEGDARYIDAP